MLAAPAGHIARGVLGVIALIDYPRFRLTEFANSTPSAWLLECQQRPCSKLSVAAALCV